MINVPEETTWRFDVKMAPGRNISGRVVDSNSHAVANARVSATTAGLGTSHGLANTNELGEFVLMDLDDGKYFLTADAGDAGQGRTDASQPVPAGAVDIEVKLTARCGAQGSVKDKVSGQPIAKFSVEVRRGSQNTKAPREIGPFAFADRKDGTFEIFGMDPVGEHVLYVTAEGFAPGYSERFTVQPGQTTRGVDVILAPGARSLAKSSTRGTTNRCRAPRCAHATTIGTTFRRFPSSANSSAICHRRPPTSP